MLVEASKESPLMITKSESSESEDESVDVVMEEACETTAEASVASVDGVAPKRSADSDDTKWGARKRDFADILSFKKVRFCYLPRFCGLTDSQAGSTCVTCRMETTWCSSHPVPSSA